MDSILNENYICTILNEKHTFFALRMDFNRFFKMKY